MSSILSRLAKVIHEEIFGPVVAVMPFDNLDSIAAAEQARRRAVHIHQHSS